MSRRKTSLKVMVGLLAGLSLVFSSMLMAEDKPVAPENIVGGKTVSAEEMIELILARPEMLIIDSRKPTEYLQGHIEGAINLVNTGMTLESLQDLAPDKSTDIVFYCNGTRCKRSADAVIKAAAWGYKNIFWFRGGWKEWSDKKLPYITGE